MGTIKHGKYLHPMYSSWSNMITRCYNKNYNEYHNYGGRGISVCEEWKNSIDSYISYMENLKNTMKPGFSPDRKNNNGNYEPDNMRWANRHIQNINKRKYKTNSTGYTGVYFDNNVGKFKAQIGINGKYKSIGRYNTVNEAASARDQYIIDNELWEYPLQILNQ